MTINRRDFISLTGVAATASMVTALGSCKDGSKETTKPAGSLTPMPNPPPPIGLAEREARVAKAKRLMAENKIEALLLDSGTAMYYFLGVSWGGSERPMVAIIPAKADVKYICPAFEESRLREMVQIGKDVYVWQEDESPYQAMATALKDAGIEKGNIGIEERTRFFIANGLQLAAPQLNYVSGDPVTIPIRLIKSAAEIQLMQRANDITLAAIQYGAGKLAEGMTQNDIADIIMKAQTELGGKANFALCLFGEASAYPHGTRKPQQLKKGDIVLMDCGCSADRYESDITRTIVFGKEPTKRQEEIWMLEKKAQDAAFAAAQLGTPCENVDAAARKVITDAGFGPGYKLPGLPHRTGHGIGIEGHEWGNMVKGNKLLLQPGMCFSIEPNISIVGEFGVRLEDCVYMTEEGPKWFSKTSKSIREPFG